MSADAFAAKLTLSALAGLALTGTVLLAVPVFIDFQMPLDQRLWPALILAACAALILSAYLLFDAMLFRLMARHESEEAGGKAVDGFLADAGLRKAPAVSRTLDERVARTMRLLNYQRSALLVFLALFVFMAAA